MQSPYARVHCIGIGGIHVSAVAKLLISLGVRVTGSDLVENEQVNVLRGLGITVAIGHVPENVPADAQAVVFSSAANETNPELRAARERNLPVYNSHQFLGVLGESMKQIVVTGTHGKSTTTAMLGVLLKEAGLNPTVVVGTNVPQFAQGNLEIGASDWLLVEGDEFDHHFLSYRPSVLVINNIEADHFDIFPTMEALRQAYRDLCTRVVDGGCVIVNGDDAECQTLIDELRQHLQAHNVGIVFVGESGGCEVRLLGRRVKEGTQEFRLQSLLSGQEVTLPLQIPGEMNVRNAAMCYAVAERLEVPLAKTVTGLGVFRGVWRRLEKIGEKDGVTVFSDYGHHPTAVARTLEAVKEFYPDRRLVLCFQPHHRNRTKHLFLEFVSSFDLADVLHLCEIYDVKGRDQVEDEAISSRDLVQAIQHHDADRGVHRELVFAENPQKSLEALQTQLKSGDVLVVMGAGDIYTITYALV